jgi:membrane protein DedA with SNARE-associated domain
MAEASVYPSWDAPSGQALHKDGNRNRGRIAPATGCQGRDGHRGRRGISASALEYGPSIGDTSLGFPAMDLLQPHIDFLADHLYGVVFGSFVIEGAGIPFPSRIVLLVAATLSETPGELAMLVLVSTLGAVIGDHAPYLAGKIAGPRLLALYCRITLGSTQCVEKTVAYFVRYGAAAILLSRFSASVRIFASALAGCGHIPYGRFVTYDVVGSVLYATLLVGVGHLIGDHAAELLKRFGGLRVLLVIGPVAMISVLAYRLWRRSRYGRARADAFSAWSCDTRG